MSYSPITVEQFFRDLAAMYLNGEGVWPDNRPNELLFDVTQINGKDRRSYAYDLFQQLKEEGLITEFLITGVGEGHLLFSDKAMEMIRKIGKDTQ